MTHTPNLARIAVGALFASVVLPINFVSAQDAPVAVTPPPVVVVTPPPPPVTSAPAPTTAPPSMLTNPPPPVTTPTLRTPVEAAPAPARITRAARPAPRATAVRPRVEAPARAAPAPAPAPAPVAEVPPPVPVTPPIAAAPLAPIAPVAPAPSAALPAETGTRGGAILPWLAAGAGLLLLAIALLMMRRRRRDEEEYVAVHGEPMLRTIPAPDVVETPYVAPLIMPAEIRAAEGQLADPAAAGDSELELEEQTDATPSIENVSVSEPSTDDVAAIAAASEPTPNRPWIEFLMRPIRAGTTSEDTRVEFELTVGNTGSLPARDVRVSTWMFAAGSAQQTDMEHMLIDPPAESCVSEGTIEPGDGTRVEASIALPKTTLEEAVLPIVVADARYRLPDGSEGRTSASFAVGISSDGELAPFPTDRSSGMFEAVEARLHGDLARR